MRTIKLILALILLYFTTVKAENYPTTSYEVSSGGVLTKWKGSETEIDLTADTYLRYAVEEIGGYAFYGNTTLRHIKLSSSVDYVCMYAFRDCANLETVTISNDGNQYEMTISLNAFQDCPKLRSVSFSQYVTSMDGECFINCPSLVSLTVNSKNPEYRSNNNIIYTKSYDKLVIFPQGVTGHYDLDSRVIEIGANAFNYSRLSTIYLSNNLTTIGTEAFYRAKDLKTVVFPNSLREIRARAFLRCESLKSLVLPSSVESIGERAFSRCTSLPETVKLPASLVSIESGIFGGSTSVKRIEVAEENYFFTSIDGALYNFAGDVLLDWPAGKMENEHIEIPEGTRVIGEVAFYASQMKTISLPSSLQEIKEEAFWMSEQLTEVSIPQSVTSLESFSFGGCDSLRVIELPSTLTHLDEAAFYRYDTRLHRRVTCHAEIPVGSWDQTAALANDTLYVPEESIDFYSISPTWRDFGTIKPIPTIQKHLVTFSQSANGLLIVACDGNEIESGTEVVEGSQLTILAIPVSGDYDIGSLMVNGVERVNEVKQGNEISFNVTEPVNIIATFVPSSVEPTGIAVESYKPSSSDKDKLFNIDGRRIQGKTSTKGIYIIGHRKIHIR